MRFSTSKPIAINIIVILLFTLFTSGFLFSFYLQKENNVNIDRFYRSTSWFANRILYQSEKFLYQTKLYELNAIEQPELTRSYDLVWNRLQIFLEAHSTELLRRRHPDVTQDVQTLFDTIRSMESLLQSPQQAHSQAFIDKTEQVKADLLNLNYSLSKVLSGTISQGIRTNNDLIQYWQLFAFLITMSLAFISFRLSRRSSRLAVIDPLTQLGNRRALTKHIKAQLTKKKPITLCAIDLKRFKKINDEIGYQIGDQVLVAFAKRLAKLQTSSAFRLGGDEFVLVMPFVSNQATLSNWVNELKQQLEFIYQENGHVVSVNIRLGIAFTGLSIEKSYRFEAEKLLDQAIHALNETKQTPDIDFAFYSDAIVRIEDNKEKLHIIHSWLKKPDMPSPFIVRTHSLHTPDNDGNQASEMYFTWKHDNSLCSIDWLTEQRLEKEVVPKLLQQINQQYSQTILIRLENSHQLTLLLRAIPADLFKPDLVFSVPALVDLEQELVNLIHATKVNIGLEKVIADHLIEEKIIEYVRYWAPTHLPNTELKQQALFDLAKAFNKTTLLTQPLIKSQLTPIHLASFEQTADKNASVQIK